MKFAVWLVASSLGATLACGAASAEDSYPLTMKLMPPSGDMRLVPTPNPKALQSPAALACADASGATSADARIAACDKLIAAGKWKGKDIAWAHANLCIVYNAKAQADKALAACDEAIKLDPQRPFSYQIRAEIMEKAANPQKALADYDEAIQLGARNAAIFVNRGRILLAMGESDKALADFNQAIQINPQSSLAYIDRGGAFLAKGDADAALVDFSKTIELSPDRGEAWANRGAAYFMKGENDKAAENFRQALKLEPANAYAALWLFIARGGDDADAKAELKADSTKLSQTAWPWPVVRFYLGETDARQTLAAATAPSDQCEAQFYVGQERLLKKANDEALPYLRKAVETCPKNFVELYHARAELKKLDAAAAPKAEAAPKADTPAEPTKR